MASNTINWCPQEDVLSSVVQLLNDAMVPDSEVQRDVHKKLKLLQSSADFNYYLLYMLMKRELSTNLRSLAGILLKNHLLMSRNQCITGGSEVMGQLQHICLGLLKDPSLEVRNTVLSIILVLVRDTLGNWPNLIPQLMEVATTAPEEDDMYQSAVTVIFNVCDHLLSSGRCRQEMAAVLKSVLPHFTATLTQNDNRQLIVQLMTTLMQTNYSVVKECFDLNQYLVDLIRMSAQEQDVDVEKTICLTLVIMVTNCEDCLLVYFHEIIVYLLRMSQHENGTVALAACEFWLALTKLPNCVDFFTPYIAKLLPVLLTNMKYSTEELIALNDANNLIQMKCSTKNTMVDCEYPFSLYESSRLNTTDRNDGYYDENDDDEDFGGGGSGGDGDDDFYTGWTLRKCSASTLDALSLKFGDSLVPILLPFLEPMFTNVDCLVKEAAILTVGAVSEGCMNGFKAHLPQLVEYLIAAMRSDSTLVRVITCWTLGRYAKWFIIEDESQSYFVSIMTILLNHFVHDNPRIQQAAISAFCVFEEIAEEKLTPYVDVITDAYKLGFDKFGARSLYLLYDAIAILARSVGDQLDKAEFSDKLLPSMLKKLAERDLSRDDSILALLECISSLVPILHTAFLPYTDVLYTHCINVVVEVMQEVHATNENEEILMAVNKEPLHSSLDLLYSMIATLKQYLKKTVVDSALLNILLETMQDPFPLIRQASFALYGELITMCPPAMITNRLGDYLTVIVRNLNETCETLCTNAAWILSKLCTVHSEQVAAFLPAILEHFTRILDAKVAMKSLHQTVALSTCSLFYVFPDFPPSNSGLIMAKCCTILRTVGDSHEKDIAYRGLCQLILRQPIVLQQNFLSFCDSIACWYSVSYELKMMVRNVLMVFKEHCSEEDWKQYSVQFSDVLTNQLNKLYDL